MKPHDPEVENNSFDLIFDTVGLEITRQNAIKLANPGATIIHIGLTQPAGIFDFRKATLQEITFIGTYCYTNNDFAKTLETFFKKNCFPRRGRKRDPRSFFGKKSPRAALDNLLPPENLLF